MKKSPDIYWKFTTALIYATADACFFLMFALAYSPFDMEEALGIGRGLVFNALMLSCIIYGTILLLHSLLWILRDKLDHSWWAYIGWWAMELMVTSAYMAMFLTLSDENTPGYFPYLSLSLKYTFSITVYSHTILNLVFVIIAFTAIISRPVSTGLVKFYDSNKKLKLSVDKESLLYISAEENYVRIHYLDGESLSDYLLRRSMNSLEESLTKAGLVRCHRSYYVNPSQVKAIKKESNGMISADISRVHSPIPVSKSKYLELSERI